MEINELLWQNSVARLVLAQKCAQSQGSMSRSLFLNRDADSENCMPTFPKGRKALAQSAGAGEKVHNAETRGQGWLLLRIQAVVYQVLTGKPGRTWPMS